MTDPAAFVLAALALLATPGPTNTLLAASGAAAGFWHSLHLVLAETIGYAIAVAALGLWLGPVVHASDVVGVMFRLGCSLFLLYAAWKLWRDGAAALTSARPVKFVRVLTATVLNPKAAVLAFVIVPHLSRGEAYAALPYAAALIMMIAIAGSAWIGTGAALRASAGHIMSAGAAKRGGALVLGAFALLISSSALGV